MPEQDPTMQLEQPPVAHFEPQLASQQHERFNAAHNTFRRIGAVAGATLAFAGAAMADREEGPLGTESAQAALIDTDPAYKAKLARYDLSRYPNGYFDKGIPDSFIEDCVSAGTDQAVKVVIRYANKQKTRVNVTVTDPFYKDVPECELAGKRVLMLRFKKPNKLGSYVINNSPIRTVKASTEHPRVTTSMPIKNSQIFCNSKLLSIGKFYPIKKTRYVTKNSYMDVKSAGWGRCKNRK
jgi:hypothetical protein